VIGKTGIERQQWLRQLSVTAVDMVSRHLSLDTMSAKAVGAILSPVSVFDATSLDNHSVSERQSRRERDCAERVQGRPRTGHGCPYNERGIAKPGHGLSLSFQGLY